MAPEGRSSLILPKFWRIPRLWDLGMSGDRLTPHSWETFPRGE